ncbi:MAG: hypothetical protein CM1200mP29_09930 [Verrucomicrobiota bacterium]|nr:MAG: hypothetical protein CM1200mP29_09930 [Verrucomicrobiota bacterium]
MDVFANDLGFIANIEDDKIVGYNVTVGGGMGMSHGKETTYPRLADVLGFCTQIRWSMSPRRSSPPSVTTGPCGP